MRYLVLIISIVVSLSLCSCQAGKSRGRIEQKLATEIREKCEKSTPCAIRIKEVIDFEWDKMFAFKTNATHEDINKVLGTSLPLYVEFSRKLIFLKDGKIVYVENWLWNLDSLENGDIVFDMLDDKIYAEYLPETSEFTIIQMPLIEGKYYKLTQVNPLLSK